MVPCALAKAS